MIRIVNVSIVCRSVSHVRTTNVYVLNVNCRPDNQVHKHFINCRSVGYHPTTNVYILNYMDITVDH